MNSNWTKHRLLIIFPPPDRRRTQNLRASKHTVTHVVYVLHLFMRHVRGCNSISSPFLHSRLFRPTHLGRKSRRKVPRMLYFEASPQKRKSTPAGRSDEKGAGTAPLRRGMSLPTLAQVQSVRLGAGCPTHSTSHRSELLRPLIRWWCCLRNLGGIAPRLQKRTKRKWVPSSSKLSMPRPM